MKKELIDINRLPEHVAIILDGNGRWAKKRMMPRNYGHKKGADRLLDIVLYCRDINIKYLTVYAFSTENWKRSKEEVDYLMDLPLRFLDTYKEKFKDKNIKFVMIGSKKELPLELKDKIEEVEDNTKDNNGLTFNFGFNYGSQDEIIKAVKEIVFDYKNDKISIEDINKNMFENYLYTKGMPNVDLMIRTSGEIRISNFLLWKISYSELYFTATLWPDFTRKEMDKALIHFQKRDRRFGGRNEN